jgi:hypothetical protein
VAALAGAGGGFSMVEAGVLPGRYRLAPYLGRCGDMPPLPRVQPGAVREFTSKAGRTVIGLPPGSGRVGAVAAASPALSQSDTTALPVGLKDIPASLTCGRDDPLSDPTAKLLARLRGRRAEATGGIYAGCHDSAFRRRMLPAQIAFLGRHLH